MHATIGVECKFVVARELLLTCKSRLHEGKITRIKILLKEVSFFNSSVISAMLLFSNWVHGNFQDYVDNCSRPSSRIKLSQAA